MFATKTTTEKKGELLRRAEGKPDAENLKAKLVTELLEKGPTQLVAGKVTFRQLVQHAKDNTYVPAVFDENRLKHNNTDALVLRKRRLTLRRLWRAAYAEGFSLLSQNPQ